MGDGEDLGVMAAAERDDLRGRCAVLTRELAEVRKHAEATEAALRGALAAAAHTEESLRGALTRTASNEAAWRARAWSLQDDARKAADVRAILVVRLARELRGLADEIERIT